MNEEPLLKRTLRTAGIMSLACVLFLGALSLTAMLLLRAPSASDDASSTKTTTTSTKKTGG